MKELEQAIEVLTKLRVDAFKHNQDGLEKSLYELEQMIFKAQDSLQSKGKTKEGVRQIMNDFTPKVYEFLLKPPFHMGHTQHAIACEKFADIRNQFVEEYAQSHAKPTHSGKTKEQVWEEVQSYHQIEGTIPEGSRVEAAVYDAMERFTNQDGCKVVPWQCCPVCNGSGQVYQPLSTGILRTCPTCEGKRIIPMHVTPPQP